MEEVRNGLVPGFVVDARGVGWSELCGTRIMMGVSVVIGPGFGPSRIDALVVGPRLVVRLQIEVSVRRMEMAVIRCVGSRSVPMPRGYDCPADRDVPAQPRSLCSFVGLRPSHAID